MEYITSRGFHLPESSQDFAKSFWFNLWKRKLWPYREIELNDIIFWYETLKKRITWKSRVIDIENFFYKEKNELRQRLSSRFEDFDINQSYYVKGPERGYCIAFKVEPLNRISLPKPDAIRFPQLGWLRVNEEISRDWLKL